MHLADRAARQQTHSEDHESIVCVLLAPESLTSVFGCCPPLPAAAAGTYATRTLQQMPPPQGTALDQAVAALQRDVAGGSNGQKVEGAAAAALSAADSAKGSTTPEEAVKKAQAAITSQIGGQLDPKEQQAVTDAVYRCGRETHASSAQQPAPAWAAAGPTPALLTAQAVHNCPCARRERPQAGDPEDRRRVAQPLVSPAGC